METIFSKILSGEIPCEKIYEDDFAFAFLDINPVNPGHALVIPKTWSAGFLDASEDTICRLIPAIQKVAKAVKEATGAEGVNIIQNEGAVAGQKVFHLHFHVIPRHAGDGREHWHGNPISAEEAKAVGEKIRAKLG
ncbi:HIT family protein [Patescibacteria group bacterium]|jgi:histidine triad (HIT) family protein|nr:HIT family protein [Patescibacteria group bacterium]